MKRLSMMLAAAGAALTLTAPPAEAVLTLTLTDTGTGSSVTCLDPGGGPVGCTIVNPTVVTFNGAVGGWTTALTSAFTNSPGSPTLATLDITSLFLMNNTDAIGNFSITATATGYSLPPGDPLFFFGSASMSSIGTSGTTTSISYFDPSDSGLLLNPITCVLAPGTNSSCAEPGINVNNGGGTYSITQVLNITNVGIGQTLNLTANQSVRSVPEPGSLALAAGALLIAAGVARRRRS